MKVRYEKNGTVTLSEISPAQMNAITHILHRANDTCFNEQDEDDGEWYSNEDFVVSLTNEERQALNEVCNVI